MKLRNYLQESPVFALNAAYEAIVTPVNQRLKKEDLNLLQGLVLTALFFEESDEMTPSALADEFKTSRGNMSHIISHLEYKGFVKRRVREQDARQFCIELKPDGRKKALSLIKFYDKLQSLFEEQLGSGACKKATLGIHQLSEVYKKEKRA
ncbi:MarR family winged helix-turn-helix transcriptional regulator [Bdellovibrio sp. HCB337]|uniref:MarR family winged helix-turn-helix transcriptional regulator n=1 Tax=Bdellovibrio sp. HCB337 TaxID=3394358 RepID=UPI0039A4A0C8